MCIFLTHLFIFIFLLTFFIRTASTSCSFSQSNKFLLSDFILLAVSFDIIWNSMEYLKNLDNILQYLSKTFDIWVEHYLTIFNNNLAIFDDRNVHTRTRKYHPKDLLPSGNQALMHLQADQWFFLEGCDLFLVILVSHTS